MNKKEVITLLLTLSILSNNLVCTTTYAKELEDKSVNKNHTVIQTELEKGKEEVKEDTTEVKVEDINSEDKDNEGEDKEDMEDADKEPSYPSIDDLIKDKVSLKDFPKFDYRPRDKDLDNKYKEIINQKIEVLQVTLNQKTNNLQFKFDKDMKDIQVYYELKDKKSNKFLDKVSEILTVKDLESKTFKLKETINKLDLKDIDLSYSIFILDENRSPYILNEATTSLNNLKVEVIEKPKPEEPKPEKPNKPSKPIENKDYKTEKDYTSRKIEIWKGDRRNEYEFVFPKIDKDLYYDIEITSYKHESRKEEIFNYTKKGTDKKLTITETLKNAKKVKIVAEIRRNSDDKLINDFSKTINDITDEDDRRDDKEDRVKIYGIYVEDEELIIDGKYIEEIEYKIDDDRWKTTRKKKILLNKKDFPIEIQLKIKNDDDTWKKTFKIKKDNILLYGDLPSGASNKIDEDYKDDGKVKEGNLKQHDMADNVFIVDKNTEVNLNKDMDDLLDKYYGKYHDEDIKFDLPSKISTSKSGDRTKASFKDKGIFKIEVTNKEEKKKDLTVLVLVKDKNEKTTRDTLHLANDLSTTSDTIKPSSLLKIDLDSRKIEDNYFMVLEGEKYARPIDETIRLYDNEVVKVKVYDAFSNMGWNLSIVKNQDTKIEEDSYSFTDITAKNWAYNDIKDLAKDGVIKGYEDGSFRPKENVEVKEFLTLLGRQIDKNEDKFSVVSNKDVKVELDKDDWGYKPTKKVFERITKEKLENFNTKQLTRKITREEVAFLIANTMDLNEIYRLDKPTDIANSKYKEEIERLFDNNILNGYPDKTFRGQNNITREEVAHIIYLLRNIK